jgi:hypothetical protein
MRLKALTEAGTGPVGQELAVRPGGEHQASSARRAGAGAAWPAAGRWRSRPRHGPPERGQTFVGERTVRRADGSSRSVHASGLRNRKVTAGRQSSDARLRRNEARLR